MRVYVFAVIALLFAGSHTEGLSQSLLLSNPAGLLSNGDSIFFEGGDVSLDVPLYITNTTSNDLGIMVMKTVLLSQPGSISYFCWGQCHPDSVIMSSFPVIIPAGHTDSLNFTGHYVCQGNPGMARIRWTFFLQEDPKDTVAITSVFDACKPAGISAIFAGSFLTEPYPNPAVTHCYLTYSLGKDVRLSRRLLIHNLAGGLVMDIPLTSPDGTITIDVSMLQPGIYFCAIEAGGYIAMTRRLIVK